jgi:PAS domain S-box-containing protein
VLGYDYNEIIGRNGFEFVHPEDVAWAFDSFQKEVVENPEVKFITIRLLHRNGHWVWCMVRGHNLLRNPAINSIVVYFHDDTLRKQASEALKESEKRFRTMIQGLHIGILLKDQHGNIQMSNEAMHNMFDVSEKDVVNQKIWELYKDVIHEDGRPFSVDERPSIKAIATKKLVTNVVMGVKRADCEERIWIMVNADPFLDDQGNIKHIVCAFTNITQRKKLEKKLLQDQISHQKQLTQATIDGQEKERTEIGTELHDNIGQQLTTIKLFLDMAKSTADEATIEMVSMALKGVSDVINEVRSMSRSLVPSTLKDLGLIESISELIDSITRTQLLSIELEDCGFTENHLPENLKLTMFRIVQEQLNNIVKHANAREVFIRLSQNKGQIILELQDDGKGLELNKIRKGLGFINIKNRAELFGGTNEIISAAGKGCLLRVTIPFVSRRVEFITRLKAFWPNFAASSAHE